MASISESYDHRKIRECKQGLQQDARTELNSGVQGITGRVSNLVGISQDKNEIVDTTGLHLRIITNTLTRSERRKVREMVGLSK